MYLCQLPPATDWELTLEGYQLAGFPAATQMERGSSAEEEEGVTGVDVRWLVVNSGDKFEQMKTWRHPELSRAEMDVHMHDPYARQHAHASLLMALHVVRIWVYTYLYIHVCLEHWAIPLFSFMSPVPCPSAVFVYALPCSFGECLSF